MIGVYQHAMHISTTFIYYALGKMKDVKNEWMNEWVQNSALSYVTF